MNDVKCQWGDYEFMKGRSARADRGLLLWRHNISQRVLI
jgi:hypothetical protein